MIRRTSEQWLTLFDQHKTNGLTQTEFSKQQGIDPSYFSLRKRQLLAWLNLTPDSVQKLKTLPHLEISDVLELLALTPSMAE